jgi:glycosyltransferase involved in cell wall biosynthesis
MSGPYIPGTKRFYEIIDSGGRTVVVRDTLCGVLWYLATRPPGSEYRVCHHGGRGDIAEARVTIRPGGGAETVDVEAMRPHPQWLTAMAEHTGIFEQHHDRKLRILIIADMCNPRMTSVPLEAYSLAKALSARDDLDVTLVTHGFNREALEPDPIAARARLHFIELPSYVRQWLRLGYSLRGGKQLSWTTMAAFGWPVYMLFEKRVFRQFRDKLRGGSFDLVHRICPVSPTYGSPLASLTKVPMVIGPLNGGLPWPYAYPRLQTQEREWLVPLRKLYRWLPYYRSTYRHIRGVIVGSWHTAMEIPTWYRGRRYYVPENGVDPERIPIAAGWRPPEPGHRFRFVTVGRLVPYKGFDLVLQAMALSRELRRGAELLVIGDGPSRAALEGQASEVGLSSIVTFAGWVEHTQLQDHLLRAQAFVFPSLREFGGGVVLEAMASGLPPIVVNYGGPGELVTDECGIRLPMAPREELVGQLSAAMSRLLRDPDQCQRMSAAGIDRVRCGFTWSRKAAQIVTIYRDVLGLPHADSRPVPLGPPPAGFWWPPETEEPPVDGPLVPPPEPTPTFQSPTS